MPRVVSFGGENVPEGTLRRIEIPVARLPTHTMLHLPVTVVHGRREGARVWLSAALHGDELNGMEIIRRVLERVAPERLGGLLVAVPVVNVFGFVIQSRYLPDRRDLNRSFPGGPRGSLAARLAHQFMTEVVGHCTHGIDLHTAAPPRINLPHVRGNLDVPEVRRLASAFGAPVMLHGKPPAGSLRAAAGARGVPVLAYEAGESLRFNEDALAIGVDGVLRVLAALEMIPREDAPAATHTVETRHSKWIRAPQSGVAYIDAALGQRVERDQLLARVGDPFGEATLRVRAPRAGVVIGRTNHPLVHRGDAIVHLAFPDGDAPAARAATGRSA